MHTPTGGGGGGGGVLTKLFKELGNFKSDFLPKIDVHVWGESIPKLLTELWKFKFWIFGIIFSFFGLVVNGVRYLENGSP